MDDPPPTESELASANMGLVRAVAMRFRGRGAEFEDLVQIGAIGLVKAIRCFDPERGTRFSTYAVPVIAGEIRRFLRDSGAVKVSRGMKELAAKLEKLIEEAEKRGESPRLCDIAATLGVDPEDAAAALCAAQPPISLSEPVFDDDAETKLSDTVPAADSTESDALQRVYLGSLLSSLGDTEKRLVHYRYFMELTQKETAELLSMTQPRVSRLEAKIMMKLRSFAEK
jgi:RNA polymerase sporulation-specific sigma factor